MGTLRCWALAQHRALTLSLCRRQGLGRGKGEKGKGKGEGKEEGEGDMVPCTAAPTPQ